MMGVKRLAGVICTLCIFCADSGFGEEDSEDISFPPNFLLGAATSAYQTEGAWNVSGKGESIWDRFVHQQPSPITNNATGDVGPDSYNKFQTDIALLSEIGFNCYRFSISWSRILPHGFSYKVNKDGIKHYHDVIDKLLANNIEPIVTLYHWDLPQVLEDAGGWTNPNIVDWFGDYCKIVFKEYGPKVKKFITVNEPSQHCVNAYVTGYHAPGKVSLRGIGEYLCMHHLLKAHARAYRIYEEEFKSTQKGSIGINLQILPYYPKNNSELSATELAFQFSVGWILHPIYSEEGDYPEIMKQMIGKKSKEQGFARSRLPEFTKEWIDYIRGSSDFLAVNYYTSREVVLNNSYSSDPSYYDDRGFDESTNPSWKSSASPWLKVYPRGFRDSLNILADRYGNPHMYVTENGVSSLEEIDDASRIDYFQSHVKEMLLAINRDHVNVSGYIAWALLDSFEWSAGYSRPFGIIHVDFTDPERPRTLKKSACWWKDVIKNQTLSET